MTSSFHSNRSLTREFASVAMLGLLLCLAWPDCALGQQGFQVDPNAGAGDVIVRDKRGGLIFGFEVDPNGTEGLLCEAVLNSDGPVSARVETFRQSNGKIIRVLAKSESRDDFIAWTVAGSVGLIEREKVRGLFDIKRTFSTIDPLSGNEINGDWNPPIDRKHIINQVKPSLDGSANVAVYALDVSTNATPVVFQSDRRVPRCLDYRCRFGRLRIDGLNFQGGDHVFPVKITLDPSRRMGFVNGPDLTTAIQSFSY